MTIIMIYDIINDKTFSTAHITKKKLNIYVFFISPICTSVILFHHKNIIHFYFFHSVCEHNNNNNTYYTQVYYTVPCYTYFLTLIFEWIPTNFNNDIITLFLIFRIWLIIQHNNTILLCSCSSVNHWKALFNRGTNLLLLF